MAFNFPDVPTIGQTFQSWTWDGEKWIWTVGGISATPPALLLDGLTGVSGAWSAGRKLLTAYSGAYTTDISGESNVWLDQTGNARNLTADTSSTRPDPTTSGPYSRACLDFNGSTDTMQGASINNFVSAADGYFIAAFIADVVTSNAVNIYDNDPIFCDATGYMGLHIYNSQLIAFNYFGGSQVTTGFGISAGNVYVAEWWHTGGVLSCRLNGLGTTQTVSSGNTGSTGGLFRIGRAQGGAPSHYYNGRLFEMVAFSTVPGSTTRDTLAANLKAYYGA